MFTIDLSRQDYDLYYRGFANGTLWPVLHYQIGLGHFEWPDYEGYRRVNGMFAHALQPKSRAETARNDLRDGIQMSKIILAQDKDDSKQAVLLQGISELLKKVISIPPPIEIRGE